MIERPWFLPRPLSTYGVVPHQLAVAFRRAERGLERIVDGHVYASQQLDEPLSVRVKRHQSVLVRRHPGSDFSLQLGKVKNLEIVVPRIHGLLLRPGETFSFWARVGRPSARGGFQHGMELSRGVARAGVGGGICQVSNLLYWLALHTPLEIVERHHHSFDPFPDRGRVLPFASGATVAYNYRDLRLRNHSTSTFQLRLWLGSKCLHGEVRADRRQRHVYHVFERDHRFEQVGSRWMRQNRLWRRVLDRHDHGRLVREEHLVTNRAEVKYDPRSSSAANRG